MCDNCTLTLMDSADELAEYLEVEMDQIDLDGVPAPWPRLLTFENISKRFEHRLDEIVDAMDHIENYNVQHLNKVIENGLAEARKAYIFLLNLATYKGSKYT